MLKNYKQIQEMSKKNDFSIGDENISYIRETVMQIKSQLQSQDELFATLLESNKKMMKELSMLDKNIDTIISRTEKVEDDVPQEPEVPTFKFNMENKTITYQNQTIQYNEEFLFNHNDIDTLIQNFNKMRANNNIIFPQGVDYIDSFLKEEKKSGNKMIIILKINQPTNSFFYFPLNNIKELSCTQGWRVFGRRSFQKQIEVINEYKDDLYPQGHEYCKSLLLEQFKQNGCVHIVARNNDSIWTRYYFISNILRILPNEQMYLIKRRNELTNELKKVEENKKFDDFPQGVDYCEEILKTQIESNGEALAFSGFDSYRGKYMWYYLPPDQFELVCNAEWWIKDKNKLEEQIRINEQNSKDPKCVFVHGKDYCKKLIREQIENGGGIHLLVRNSVKNSWFCFKA